MLQAIKCTSEGKWNRFSNRLQKRWDDHSISLNFRWWFLWFFILFQSFPLSLTMHISLTLTTLTIFPYFFVNVSNIVFSYDVYVSAYEIWKWKYVCKICQQKFFNFICVIYWKLTITSLADTSGDLRGFSLKAHDNKEHVA